MFCVYLSPFILGIHSLNKKATLMGLWFWFQAMTHAQLNHFSRNTLTRLPVTFGKMTSVRPAVRKERINENKAASPWMRDKSRDLCL